MSPNTPISSQEISKNKGFLDIFHPNIVASIGALGLATTILTMNALENKEKENNPNTIANPLTLVKKNTLSSSLPNYEKKLGLYDFLNGEITQNETPINIQKKLKERIKLLLEYSKNSNDFSYYIGAEVSYRQATGKGESVAITQIFKQLKKEHGALEQLDDSLKNISKPDIAAMDNLVKTYYAHIANDTGTVEDIEKWKIVLEKEREILGYSYKEVILWLHDSKKIITKKKEGNINV